MKHIYPFRKHWDLLVRLCRDATHEAARWHSRYRATGNMEYLHRYNEWRATAIRDLRLLEKWAHVPHRPASLLKPRLKT